MKFKTEPVVWLGMTIIVLQTILAFLTHTVDLGTAVNDIWTALGTVVVRAAVTPIVKHVDDIGVDL